MKDVGTSLPGLDPDDYGADKVLAALGAPTPVVSSGKSVFRILFLPSFHPECLLSVTDQDGAGAIELLSMQVSLYHYGYLLQEKASGQLNPDNPIPAEPVRWIESAPLSSADIENIRLPIQSFVRSNPKNLPSAGMDGMTLQLEYWDVGRSPLIGSAWSPAPDRLPDIHRLVTAVYSVALDRLTDEKSQRLLEKLFGYLRLGLPAKDLGGTPRVLRLFGRFSTEYEKQLQAFLSAVAPGEAVLMDLSNFEGMGSLLYPLFAEFARRPGKTVWWASSLAETPLREISIPSDRIAGTRDDALKRLS